MNIPLPAALEGRLTSEEAALHLAIGLYAGDQVTLGQGASIARMLPQEFLHELGKRRITVHYGEEDLQHDLAVVAGLTSHAGNR
jgi:predicted HTH domain antitoxin